MNKLVDEAQIAHAEPVEAAPHVFQAISDVMADLSREGIGKGRKNEQQGYKFRGIDDVYNAMASILAKHRLVILPRVLSRHKEVFTTSKGSTLFYVTVEMEFQIASAVDGSSIVSRMFGEAMDSGDKATNKAMSAAYKYMAMQAFCIPTEGDNDADATTHTLADAEALAMNLLRGCGSKELFADAWNKNKDGWKRTLGAESYARLVGEMKRVAETFKAPETPPPQDDFGIGADEVPF
jgi:hypothetical protein